MRTIIGISKGFLTSAKIAGKIKRLYGNSKQLK
jgi:hypothetical protein